MESDDLEDDAVELSVCCGECDTWRAAVHGASRARVVERRLRRMVKRGRRDIRDDLRRVRLAGIGSGDFAAGRGTRPAAHH